MSISFFFKIGEFHSEIEQVPVAAAMKSAASLAASIGSGRSLGDEQGGGGGFGSQTPAPPSLENRTTIIYSPKVRQSEF